MTALNDQPPPEIAALLEVERELSDEEMLLLNAYSEQVLAETLRRARTARLRQ